jgi:hypothetical protein
MVTGVEIAVGTGVAMLLLFVLNTLVVNVAYAKGYRAGMVDEGAKWFDALDKVQPPNWQSLPDPEGMDKQQSEESRKQYVDSFKLALGAVRVEVIVARIESIKEEVLKSIQNA